MSSCGNGGSGGSSGSSGEAGGGAVADGGEAGSGPAPRTYVEAATESCNRIYLQKLADCDTSGDYYLYCYGDTFSYDKCMADCSKPRRATTRWLPLATWTP